MKFKVGDKVKINMQLYGIEGTGKVVSVDWNCIAIRSMPYYVLQDNSCCSWWCTEDELELLTKGE